MAMLKKGIKNLQAIDAKIVFGSPKLRATHIGDKLGAVVQRRSKDSNQDEECQGGARSVL